MRRRISIQADDPIAQAISASGCEAVLERLHFNADEGRIWLDDRRMLMLDASAFIAMRVELIELLGVELARGVLTRVGYLMGARDAELSWKLHGRGAPLADLFAPGPFLHSLEGFVQVQSQTRDVDLETGHCYCEFIWKNSVEHDAVRTPKQAADAGCWMALGHSSGYFTGIMGRRILVREVECESTGGSQCLAIAQPVELWDNPEDDLQYFTLQDVRHDKRSARIAVPSATVPREFSSAPTVGVVGSSSALTEVLHKVQRVARTNATVLLLGESGVGKSLFAREVHDRSRRRDGPFVAVNCAAIPESLIESELFGVERGAFSGANQSRPGRFEAAASGSIFLDEIATLTLQAQAKLLRVLQTGELERLGTTRTTHVNVRILAATNVDLEAAVRQGTFREDLYYRINVFPIEIPPLRERRDDIPMLLEACIARYCDEHDRYCPGVSATALQLILSYDWPGNIREFENVIERAIILAEDGDPIDARHLFNREAASAGKLLLGVGASGRIVSAPVAATGTTGAANVTGATGAEKPRATAVQKDAIGALRDWARKEVSGSGMPLGDALNLLRDSMINAALAETGGNVAKAAERLGVTRAQIDYRLKQA